MSEYRDGPHLEVKDRNGFYTQKNRMELCNCRLCYLALNPPKTFAIYESFGLDKIAIEHRQWEKSRVYSPTQVGET